MRKVLMLSYAFLFLLSIALLFWLIPNFTPPSSGYGIPASALPNLLASVMLICSAFLLVQTAMGKGDCNGPNPLPLPIWVHMAKYFTVLFLAFPLMSYIGFIPGSIILLATLQYFAGQRNLMLIIVISVVVSVLTYYAVMYGMDVDLNIEPPFVLGNE